MPLALPLQEKNALDPVFFLKAPGGSGILPETL
jgi:hypothetical protein